MGAEAAGRLREYQRNATFIAFVLVVCFAAFVFLMQSLRSVLIPLVWSGFFAVPICGAISFIDARIALLCSWVRARVFGARGVITDGADEGVAFVAFTGQNKVFVRRGPALDALLARANHPCGDDMRYTNAFFRRQVRVVQLALVAADDTERRVGGELGAEVNRLVEGWRYYVELHGAPVAASVLANPSTVSETSQEHPAELRLFLDAAGHYPAVLDNDAEEEAEPVRRLKGRLEVHRSSSASWTLAFLVTMVVMCGACLVFLWLISLGLTSFTDHLKDYQKGVTDIGDLLLRKLHNFLPEEVWKQLQENLKHFAESALPTLVSDIASELGSISWEALLFLVYLFFWIFEPLPISENVGKVIKSYLMLKTVVCLLFATLMSILLWCLACPLWALFFVLTFLLNYIPEIGAVLSAVLSVPAVMFDGAIDPNKRVWNTIALAIFGTIIKVVTGNIVEVNLYATRGGQFMRMHPVILMALMMLCSVLLGITGMFLAIPMLAAVKYYMIAAEMPPVLLNPLMLTIEGDETGPHKNYVDKHRGKNSQSAVGSDDPVALVQSPLLEASRSLLRSPDAAAQQ